MTSFYMERNTTCQKYKKKKHMTQWRIENPVKHGVYCGGSQRLKAINYFRKTLHLRCLTGFSISFCNLLVAIPHYNCLDHP